MVWLVTVNRIQFFIRKTSNDSLNATPSPVAQTKVKHSTTLADYLHNVWSIIIIIRRRQYGTFKRRPLETALHVSYIVITVAI